MDDITQASDLTMDFTATNAAAKSSTQTEPGTSGGPVPGGVDPAVSPPGFELLRELGRGGMGVVFLARQKNLGRQVALKMILSGGYSSDNERLRFLAEAEAVAAVSHNNIVQIFDLGTHQELPFFALEYCPGGSLAQKLGGNPIAAQEAALLVGTLARAIQAAHAKGIIHRDLKPANILLGADGAPKITDFGLARKTESASGLTQSGAIVGTPSYMAPEQAGSRRAAITPATDVYALGAILYECLTGRPPFRAASVMETIQQVLNDDPIPPSKLVPGLPRDLETICLKALRKDPEKRYPSAIELADDLGRYQSGESILARPASKIEKTMKLARRNPVISALTGAGIVAAILIVSVVTLAYLKLQKERNNANEQKEKAERRLDLAIDAVEKMMNRVGGEKWSRIPELLEERRAVMEDAIAVYQQFLEEDSDDPRLRRTSAQALFKIGAAYLTLGELEKSSQAFSESVTLTQGLMSEFPQEPDYRRDYALLLGLVGHISILDAQFELAQANYRKMVTIAEELLVEFPERADIREVLIEGLNFLGNANQNNPQAALPYYQRSLKECQPLLERPHPSFTARMQWVIAMDRVAEIKASSPDKWDMDAEFRRAMTMVEELAKEPAPNSHKADQFELMTARRNLVEAQVMIKKGNVKEAMAHIVKARQKTMDLLKVHGRNFLIRNQYINVLRMQWSLAGMLKQSELANSTNRDLIREASELEKLYPKMTWLASNYAINRTFYIIDEIQHDRKGDWENQMAEIVKTAEQSGNQVLKQTVSYNCACIHAQLALKSASEPEKIRHKKEALNKLIKSREEGYFKNPKRLRDMDADADLEPLRKWPEYEAFRNQLNPPKS